jgi:hypothetical protein
MVNVNYNDSNDDNDYDDHDDDGSNDDNNDDNNDDAKFKFLIFHHKAKFLARRCNGLKKAFMRTELILQPSHGLNCHFAAYKVF